MIVVAATALLRAFSAGERSSPPRRAPQALVRSSTPAFGTATGAGPTPAQLASAKPVVLRRRPARHRSETATAPARPVPGTANARP